MPQTAAELDEAYATALRRYLDEDNEDSLVAAYELGRSALDLGLGPLDMIMAHQRTLESLLDPVAEYGISAERAAQMSGRFLTESFSAFEMFHRARRETGLALRRMNEIMEQEAKRIAHSLHDQAGQLLATIYLELHELARTTSDEGRERISRISEHLDEVHDQLRTLSHELRPMVLDQFGLVPALRYLADGMSKRTGLMIDVEGELHEQLDDLAEIAIYRGTQEALNNAGKYSEATRVRIVVRESDEEVICTVEDDGVGFDPGKPDGSSVEGIGLVCVRERLRSLDGKMEIQSAPGHGTTINMCVPGPDHRREEQ